MPTASEIRLLLADDHAPVRHAIRADLEEAGFVVCSEVADAAAAVEAALGEKPHVCLLDVHMPGSGVTAAWEITARLPDTKVVMLTVSHHDDHLFGALRAGASGYLLKDVEPTRLAEVLYSVVAGDLVLSRPLAARLLEEFTPRPARRGLLGSGSSREPMLSERESLVLELLKHELSTTEIARSLGFSETDVRSDAAAVLRKLRFHDRDSLTRLVVPP